MRRQNHMTSRFMATFLAIALAYGNFGVEVAMGVEAAGGNVDVTAAQTLASDEKGEPAETDDAATESVDAAAEPETQADDNASDETPVAISANSNDSSDNEASTTAEEQLPYSIEVTFGGQKLSDKDGENNFTDVWSTGSKEVHVEIRRNPNVKVDSGKQYVLSLKVPEVLSFSGIPEASKINGVEQVAMVENARPQFYTTSTSGGTTTDGKYNFTAPSGELRFKLNPNVPDVTIADLGINFDAKLLGYTADGQAIANALVAKVEAVDASAPLDSYDKSDVMLTRTVNSVLAKRSDSKGSGMKLNVSNDGFTKSSDPVNSINTGKGSTATYGVGTSGSSIQAFKELQVEFDCPYIEIPKADGTGTEKHYLDFSTSDSALGLTNKQGNTRGYQLATAPTYDSERHVITYTFKDIVLGGHTTFLYSPNFTWPSQIADESVPKEGYRIKGATWRVTKQVTYLGNDSNLFSTGTKSASNYITFIKDDEVNLKIVSSAEAPASEKLAKRQIYQGVTRANKVAGALGFFDVHNDGAISSGKVKVDFNFNTDPTLGATYYITRVNLPAGTTTSNTTVKYVVTNGSEERSGETEYASRTIINCTVGNLGFSSDWYIKSLSYETDMRAAYAFHAETAHLYRNRTEDGGLFFGFLEGNVGDKASATMTISSDENAINYDGDKSITSTETSTVADNDFVGYSIGGLGIDGSTSTFVTAGDSSTLRFQATVSTEEYQGSTNDKDPLRGVVNGYHIMRNPVAYVCLPDGVSIAGTEQAVGTIDSTEHYAKSVRKLEKSECTVDGVKAYWWEIDFGELNVVGGKVIVARVSLSTDRNMAGIAWDFSSCIAWRSKGQKMSWGGASEFASSSWNSTSELVNSDRVAGSVRSLGAALTEEGDASSDKFGFVYYANNSHIRLNVARAEAKLDVETSLSLDDGAKDQKSLKVTKADSEINYDVTVASDDGGHADDFNYYIPVPKTTSGDDAYMFVAQRDFSLALEHGAEVTATDSDGKAVAFGGDIFKVQYTTQEGLTSDGVRADSVVWQDTVTDFSTVTAVRISTVDDAMIEDGSSYKFHLTFKYQGDDFDTQAGRSVQWRSFGHYSYQRGTATPTTNSYPSQDNSVKLGFVGDYTKTPIEVTLDTAATDNYVFSSASFGPQFKNAQNLKITSVSAPNGTRLVTSDPGSLTGADANVSFMMRMGIGSGSGMTTLTSATKGESFDVSAGSDVAINVRTAFSKALTENGIDRYVDVRFGNDDVDMTVRVKLVRKVAEVAVTGSGTTAGEAFKAASVNTDSKIIASNAAFTALFDVKNFVPGNFTKQKLVWKSGVAGPATALPAGTKITMMVLGAGESSKVESWWLYTVTGSETETEIDLKSFSRMDGASDAFSYDVWSVAATELKYQFVVSLPSGCQTTGSFALAFAADPKDDVAAFSTGDMPIVLAAPASFGLGADGSKVTYTYSASAGSDSRTTGKQLALVLKPAAGSDTLPTDARLSVGGKTYARNADGAYVVPLGSVVAEGSIDLAVVSDMLGADGGTYEFDASLMLYGGDSSAPMAGDAVASTNGITVKVAAGDKPAIKVTGTRVATKAEWLNGQAFDLAMSGITFTSGMTVTVSAYKGLTSSERATDLMSSVGGVFSINGGSGTYDAGRTSTGKLQLGNNAKAGTYRLVFEVKRGDDVLLTVPYYIVVRE